MERPVHEALKPLAWLIGRWRTDAAATGKVWPDRTFPYGEEVEFFSYGQPMLNYRSFSWIPETDQPSHMESGFLRVLPDTSRLSFIVSNNFGVTTVEEGEVTEQAIDIKSINVGQMTLGKGPAVTKIERKLWLNSEGKLEQLVLMETSKHPLTEHLKAVYNKIH